ncbi:hypothetical protein [Deinococcus sp. JMULE3]|uniref:hypothetical protein n=1 Tax=Deinococcus sp. JMULE3 TaxID=2518341 RepID=UPI0015774C42|nr:hypothetical protein [Deinococcus sp. JMULE3]NTY02493.1 hypothetical protein [Deinococcus sp. JMULE3]
MKARFTRQVLLLPLPIYSAGPTDFDPIYSAGFPIYSAGSAEFSTGFTRFTRQVVWKNAVQHASSPARLLLLINIFFTSLKTKQQRGTRRAFATVMPRGP